MPQFVHILAEEAPELRTRRIENTRIVVLEIGNTHVYVHGPEQLASLAALIGKAKRLYGTKAKGGQS